MHFRTSLPEALDHHRARFASDIVEWAENFFIAPGQPIVLLPHQQAILRLFVSPAPNGSRRKNLLMSTVKKSGKTAMAALLVRYMAETSPPYSEFYLAANDLDQAVNRVFSAVKNSIEMDPDGRKRWTMTDRELRYGNGTFIRALASDYKGEAGSNPRGTVWTELWGYEHEKERRLFEELTPVPTQESFRIVETSAGYEGQSDLLRDLYELGLSGRRLTAGDLNELTGAPLGCFAEAPNPDSLVPIWVHEKGSLVMYWDEGVIARRMPWQVGPRAKQYYLEQEKTLRPSQYRRLHLNQWSQSEEAFVPIEWWDACREDVPELDTRTSLVLGVDAAVSQDTFAVVGVTRHWDPARRRDIAVRLWGTWEPVGGRIDTLAVYEELVRLTRAYRVAQIAFDPCQLEFFMANLKAFARVWTNRFDQGRQEK